MTVGASTRLTGLIGYPVSHSLSPQMQNAAFAAAGLDWVYVPLPVDPQRVGEAVHGLVALEFAGANVTIPHKAAVLPYCDEVDEVAGKAGSVNTLVVRDGRVLGSSTDGLAVTESVDVAGARILLLGAGGAAQAVACAVLDAGAEKVAIAGRRQEACAALVRHLHAAFGDDRAVVAAAWPPDPAEATIVLNATPLKDDLVVTPWRRQQVVDLAYRPDGGPTALVAAARGAGCDVVVDGLEILVRQGAASFERWTGVAAPLQAMRVAIGA